MLEAESGFNDAPVVILVVAFCAAADGHDCTVPCSWAEARGAGHRRGHRPRGWAGSAPGGSARGAARLRPLPDRRDGDRGLAYGAADGLHGSGFLAVYLAAMVLGNAKLPHWPATRGFADGLGWIAQIGMFVLLGLLVTPHELVDAVLPALVIGLVLPLVARPLSVVAS